VLLSYLPAISSLDRVQEQDQTKSATGQAGPLSRFFLLSFGYVAFRFLLSPLRTRILTEILPKDLYGSLTLAVMTLTFISTLSSLGGFEFLVRRLPGLPPPLQKGWLRLLLIRLALPGWFVAGALAAVAKSAGWIPALSAADLVLLWIGLGLTSWLLYRVFFSLGCGDLVRVRGIQMFQNDLWFIGIVAAGSWAATSLTNSLWVWTAWLAATAIGLRFWKRLPAATTRPPESLRAVIHYGAPLLPMICGEILFRLADRYVLLGFCDMGTVAEYTLCMNVAMMVYVMGASLLDMTIPSLYAARNRRTLEQGTGPTNEMREVFGAMMRHVWGVGLPAGVALCFFHRDIFAIVSGPAFRDASALLPSMAFIPLAFLSVTAVSRALLALDRPRWVGGATFAAAILNLALDFVTVPRWGAIGAAMATLFSMVALAVSLGWVLGWRSWVRRADLRPGAIAAATLACSAGFAVLRWGFPDMSPWLRLPAAGLLAVAALWGTRIFSSRDVLALRGAPAPESD
jgi:O-antigen/teichoic acid export membrane protein